MRLPFLQQGGCFGRETGVDQSYEVSWTEPTDPNVLYTLKQRIVDAGVIDSTEMRDMVTALLT